MPSGILLTGKRFGYLTVGRELKCDVYRCECKCGTKIEAFRSQLTKGVLRHCGCKLDKIGREPTAKLSFGHHRTYIGRDGKRHSKSSSEYLSWSAMKNRCLYPTTIHYKDYGARGITICPRWIEPRSQGFRNFIDDMGPRPVGKTLDRRDVQGHYTPENCRWADASTQGFNRRCILFPDGEGEPPVVPMEIDADLACA